MGDTRTRRRAASDRWPTRQTPPDKLSSVLRERWTQVRQPAPEPSRSKDNSPKTLETPLRLEKVTLSGFRCFGPQPTEVILSPHVTAIVGPNAAGKTALLHALSKMFGVSRRQRTVVRSDFHVGADQDGDDRFTRTLYVDVLIGLPELAEGTATPETVAPAFRHMLIDSAAGTPSCRMRLEAIWEDDRTAEGEVSQDLYWVDTLDIEPARDKLHPVSAADRGLIQLLYTPAIREPAAQVRATTGALAARLLKAIAWSAETERTVEKASERLGAAFEGEAAITAIVGALRTRWSGLHDEVVDAEPRLSLVSRRFEEVVDKLAVIFEDGPDGRERGLDELSDGQQSLFYFALAAALFDLERGAVAGSIRGFHGDVLTIPALTLFAVEEPENHLSPYYLARIVRQLRSMTASQGAQAIVTSHSPAVLSRVDPGEVRYCRRDPTTRMSDVRRIVLPPDGTEEAKFVRGAMLAFPEFYFARFVLLVEGDSERIVLPRLAEALDLLIDPAFVAIVPLGGRHVQQFWNLLTQLGIPYATLLDLDLGREGGGFGRVKTVLRNLIAVGVPRERLLDLNDGSLLPEEDLDVMHRRQKADELEDLSDWIDSLIPHGVYFSKPLDLDLAMLRAFEGAYDAIIPEGGGPRMTSDKAAAAVLGTAGPGLDLYVGRYDKYPDLLPAYRYHFLTNSKPATHLAALARLDKATIAARMPRVLRQVLGHIAASMRRG